MGSTSSNLTQTRSDSQYNFYRNNQEESSIIMPNVKLTYFNLRARGEPCRLLLAYGGIKYEDNRIAPPWDPTSTWSSLKPTTPFGQLPVLSWDGVEICQSMDAARSSPSSPSSPTSLRESAMFPTSRPGLSPDQKLICKHYDQIKFNQIVTIIFDFVYTYF